MGDWDPIQFFLTPIRGRIAANHEYVKNQISPDLLLAPAAGMAWRPPLSLFGRNVLFRCLEGTQSCEYAWGWAQRSDILTWYFARSCWSARLFLGLLVAFRSGALCSRKLWAFGIRYRSICVGPLACARSRPARLLFARPAVPRASIPWLRCATRKE